MRKNFYSNGKLLLTGEYAVLDGALALAIPTRFGQSLEIVKTPSKLLHWKSINSKGKIWFEAKFEIDKEGFVLIEFQKSDTVIAHRLLKILQTAYFLNPSFSGQCCGLSVTATLDFSREWGLGSSSTLINNIAQWAKVDSFALLRNSLGGSGYDIAAAQNDTPILFQLKKGKPHFESITLPWDFTEKVFFVHLNKKQDSREGIARYKNNPASGSQIEKISEITSEISNCTSLKFFEELLTLHDEILSSIIDLPTIKQTYFSDYPNSVKSLGAWGGDFVLATGDEKNQNYFRSRGFETIISFLDMIKK